jgi:hypothetical protein
VAELGLLRVRVHRRTAERVPHSSFRTRKEWHHDDQYIEFRLALHIDKSWRHDENFCVQTFSSRRFAQVADGDYAITVSILTNLAPSVLLPDFLRLD